MPIRSLNKKPSSSAIKLARQKKNRRNSHLVRAVVAVGYAVALVRLEDAHLLVGAGELGAQAGDGRAVHLVLLVEAVVVAVADPGLGYAVTGPRTGELEVRAGLGGAKVTLVRAVAAVVLRVALPVGRDASGGQN